MYCGVGTSFFLMSLEFSTTLPCFSLSLCVCVGGSGKGSEKHVKIDKDPLIAKGIQYKNNMGKGF